MIHLTPNAVAAIKRFLSTQAPDAIGIRLAVKGGGCSGFEYDMATVYDHTKTMLDRVYLFDGLKFFVDQASFLYLDGVNIDWSQSLTGSSFQFTNPNAVSTCGCGSSFKA
jgi:iron-sulfur cluster assembly protein